MKNEEGRIGDFSNDVKEWGVVSGLRLRSCRGDAVAHRLKEISLRLERILACVCCVFPTGVACQINHPAQLSESPL